MHRTQGFSIAMTASHLLQELETLPHHARILRMVELGRAAAHDPTIAATVVTLEQGDFYARFLALHACFSSYDGAHVLRSLVDPSRTIRGTAISLSVLTCDETQLRQALRLVPRDGRLPLLWKLRHHGHAALIDEFLEHLAETGDPQLRKLLPCGSPTLVQRLIGRFAHTLNLADWRRLARRHSALACELLQTRADSAISLDIQLVAFANGVLPILANKQPDQTLMLVATLARTVPLARLDLDALLMQRPTQLVDLALQGEELGELAFHRVVQRLDTARLVALIETYYAAFAYHQEWLPALKPETRLALYTVLAPVWRDRRGCLAPEIVELLPRAQREQEGRRHLALSALATRPEERLPFTIGLRVELAISFLPWDEVATLLIETATTGILHADALQGACQQLSLVSGRYSRSGRSDSKEMGWLEEALASHPDERLRQIALATLIIQVELPPGWTKERRERLQNYRADPSPLVAAAAQFTVVPPAEA